MSTCPNVNSQEWKDLVAEMSNSRIKAMQAFKENGGEIPALDSEIVKRIKNIKIEFGPAVEIVMDDEGKQTDKYKSTSGKLYNRISGFINNFAARRKDKDRTYPEREADKKWGDLDHDEKLMTRFGKPQTYEEYKDKLDENSFLASAKGILIHLAIQMKLKPQNAIELAREIEAVEDEVRDRVHDIPFSWKWIQKEGDPEKGTKGTIEKIFDNLGINFFHNLTMEEEIIRDEVDSEVIVSSDLFGLAGTIDMLVHHADGKYSIVDWKTGSSVNKAFRGLDNLMMQYGNQGSQEIEDSVRNRYKLQIALYAILLRSQNPDIQFRSLNLAWIPNKYNSLRKDRDSAVDPMSFIPMIEQFLKDPLMAEAAGLPRDIHAKLVEKDPSIFDPSNYGSTTKGSVINDLMLEDYTPEELVAEKISRLRLLLGGAKDFEDFPEERKKEIVNLLDEINSIMMPGGIDVNTAASEDMSFINLWLGNWSEVNHPMIQSLKRYKDKQQTAADRVTRQKVHKFNSLLRPVLKKYYKDNKIINIGGNRSINYDKLYGWMYTEHPVDEETNETIERLLTNSETDADKKAAYDALTEDQKKLLDYVNDTFRDYFVGEKAYLNELAFESSDGKKSKTYLQLHNLDKKPNDRRTWYNGFFFKVAPTSEDIISRNGEGNFAKGLFSKKTLGSMIYKYATFFEENAFEGWKDNSQAIPIKHLGNEKIDYSRSYTRNMEVIFNQAISEMESKRHNDNVWALGKAMSLHLSKDKEGQPAYSNLIKFLDHKMMMTLQRKMHVTNARGRKIRIPMYTPDGWKHEKVSIDAVMRGLTKWASMNTMWFRPFQGIGNGVHAMMLTHRDGLKGSISSLKITGISENAVDYTSADLVRAEAKYFADFVGEAIKGDFRKSKMYLMAKEFDYFGNNYDYADMQKSLLSLHNRYMKEGTMYMWHRVPEEFVSMTTMAAQLMHMKNEKTGKSIWDSYEAEKLKDENGNETDEYHLVWKGGVRGVVKKSTGVTEYTETLTGLDSVEMAKIRKVHERLQGGYRKDEATILEAYALGKMIIHLKKYLPRLILNSFHSKRTETDLGYYKKLIDPKTGEPVMVDINGESIPKFEWVARITEGRMITLGSHIVNLVTAGKVLREYRWSNLKDEQRQNLIEAALTLAIFLTAYGSYIKWFDDLDDDDTTKKWFKMYMVDNLSQQYNMVDLARTMKTAISPVAFSKVAAFSVHGSMMLLASIQYSAGNDDVALTKKGDLKGWNSFIKTIPILSSYYDTKNRINNVKDPESFLGAGLETIRLK